jgi:hypothetical protein
MATEGYQSSGNSNITVSEGSNPPPPPPGGGNTTIVVRARGTSGSESIQLQVNNATIATWTLSTSMQNYTASTSSNGGINVRFTNDATNRDVQVDYIQVNGSTRQAENQTTNTGVYQNGACGGSRSEWMHCNGYIGFGNVSGRLPSPEPTEELEQVEESTSLNIYPNPVEGKKFTVEVPEGTSEVWIHDLNGKMIKGQALKGERSIEMELNATPGVYLMRAIAGSQSHNKKFFIR